MTDVFGSAVPEVFGATSYPVRSGPDPTPRARRPRSPRIGQRAILLSARNGRGRSILLAFTRTRGGVAFWRSLSPDDGPLEHVGSFPGPLDVRVVAGLLASGAARPAVDAELVEDAWVEGVESLEADLLRLAWGRVDGRLDPRAPTVLALPGGVLADACDRVGVEGVGGLLDLGERVGDANRRWLERHRAAMDEEVDRRAAGAGERERRELRAFVEECLLTLGRLPRSDESATNWDGMGVAGRDLGRRELRRLGLYQTGRAGGFRVWVRFWSGADSLGRGDFGSGVGWYWDVTNPDPGWRVDGIMGPCDSAEEAWSEAHCLEEQE